MTTPNLSDGDVCPRCGAAFGACALSCPTLRLPYGYRFEDDPERGAS